MLFDLRGRGRQRTVKVVYITLAFLMGGGLVLFGIGGNTSGGLVDAITGSSGSGAVGADRYEKDIAEARRKLKADPKDETAHAQLVRAYVSLAGTGDQFNSATGQYTAAGKADLRDASEAWKAYQAIGPKDKEEEARVASRMVQAYAALGDVESLVGAQEVVALNRDAVGPYAQLANYAYLAGQTRKGDLAAKKALSLEDPDQRQQLKADLEQAKQQGAQQAAQAAASAIPEATPTLSPKEAKKQAEELLGDGKGGKKKGPVTIKPEK